MQTPTESSPREYEFGPAEKRGYILGLQPLQIGAIAVFSLFTTGFLLSDRIGLALLTLVGGALASLLPISPLHPFVVTWHDRRIMPVLQDGRPAVLWLPIIGTWARRRLSGEHRWASAMHLDQTIVLSSWGEPGQALLDSRAKGKRPERRAARRQQPPSIQGLRILQVSGLGHGMDIGVVHDPAERTFAGFVAVQGRDYALLAAAEKVRLNDLWGSVFERYGDASSPVSRVQVIERTVPEDGEALARAYEEHRIEGEHLARVHESYAELVDQAAPLAQRHECYVGIKVDLRRQAAWREAKRRGQGDTLRGALLVLFEELSVLSEALSAAELTILGALPPRLLAEVIRFGYDPEQREPAAHRERLVPGREEGLWPEYAWPSYSEERLGWYRTDGGFHITGHVREWPRRGVAAGFLQPLLLDCAGMRTFSLTYEVRPGAIAAKEFRSSATNDGLTKRIRDRWGFRDTPEREMQRENVLRAEREAAEGHAVIAWSAYVTCSGHTAEEAEEVWAEAVSRASASNLELQRLYGLQEAAFTYTLPLCRGLAS
ncbi:MAG: hypothetical protein M3256_03835 [Actinomycetota bacterium]|jgi:hypothetical protein|nr:hypothetical protein [Candidatus Dormibacteraeota bacterium]MDQ6945404.1 hypothetical protein [Actinomycetota bacterium]